MKEPVFELTNHRGESRIKVCFQHNADWNNRMKKVPGAKWSTSMKCWHIPDTEANRIKCNLPSQEKNALVKPVQQFEKKPASKKITENNQQHLTSFIQLLKLKAYSESTIKTYKNEFSAFLQTLGKIDASTLTLKRLKDYLEYCHDELKLSEHTIHSRINALKFFYEQVQKGEKLYWEIPRPKKPLQLPKLLNENELKIYSMH